MLHLTESTPESLLKKQLKYYWAGVHSIVMLVFSFHNKIIFRLPYIYTWYQVYISTLHRHGPIRCLLKVMFVEMELNITSLLATGSNVAIEPRRQSLLILLCNTMSTVRRTSRINVIGHDCYRYFLLIGGI